MEKHLIHNGKIKRDFFQEKKYRRFFQSLVSHMKLKVQVLKESENSCNEKIEQCKFILWVKFVNLIFTR